MPSTSLSPLEFHGDMWAYLGYPALAAVDPPFYREDPPPAPRAGTILLPSVDHWCENEGSSNHEFRYDEFINFPGDGTRENQFTLEGTGDLAQEAEASTSLAPAKPQNTENNNQLEVTLFLPHQRSCSILIALAAAQRSCLTKFRGWLQPHSEHRSNEIVPKPDSPRTEHSARRG